MSRSKTLRVVAVVVFTFAAVGVASYAYSHSLSAPDSVRVERVLVDEAVGQFDPFDRTVTDGAVAKQIHDALRALPSAPQPPTHERDVYCPVGWGLRYHLTFTRDGKTVDEAVLEADGCRYAYLNATDRHATTESFWALLAGSLGFYTRGNDLFPLPMKYR